MIKNFWAIEYGNRDGEDWYTDPDVFCTRKEAREDLKISKKFSSGEEYRIVKFVRE